jgi:hypothetical protein
MTPEDTSIARQLLGKHVSATTPNNGTIVERRCFLRGPPHVDLRRQKLKYKRLKLGGGQAYDLSND